MMADKPQRPPGRPVEQFDSMMNRTKNEHNGYDYSDWIRFRTEGDQFGRPMTIQDLADAFGVTRTTIYSWIARDMKNVEQA